MRSDSSHGFTLVELLVVIAIIGLVAGGLALVNGGAVRAQEVPGLARGITFAMQRARTAALSDGFQRRLLCTAAGCTVQRAALAGMAPMANWVDSTDRVQTLPQALLWAVDGATETGPAAPAGPIGAPAAIVFYPDGTATAATVFVCDPSQARRYKIYVFAGTGMPRMVDRW